MSITYRGFSTLSNAKKFTLNDFDLVKQDLVNYFSIRKGEKLMQPEFGSIIWSLLFEPLTEDIQQAITEDINRIVGYDPRLRVGQIQVLQQDNGFLVQLTLSYVPTNQVDTIQLNFNQAQTSLTTAVVPN
jgi:phage baseplate assembly protein W